MQIATIQPNGLHLPTSASLQQLGEDETLGQFAQGLIIRALPYANLAAGETITLAEALHDPSPRFYVLLTVLLALDAEVSTLVDDEIRVFPLPAFLSYRSALPLQKFPLHTLRLPSLNPEGRYRLAVETQACYAARLDLHPKLGVAGHVRLTISGPERTPVRLRVVEQRLEWHVLTSELIHSALLASNNEIMPPLSAGEQAGLVQILQQIRTG
jgi:hypothetical protein